MKAILNPKAVITALLAVLCLNLSAVNQQESIQLDKSKKTLTAPQSSVYTWYFNGQIISSEREIQIMSPGIYEVKTIDINGDAQTRTMQVAINASGEVIKIFTIGDSTVQTYDSGYYPRTGWGQVLQHFFDADKVVVDNRAVGGTSSKSFYNYYWKKNGLSTQIVNEVDSGDYVFIQFGINDAATDTFRYTQASTTFKEYLAKYVNETKAKGANPVIVATLRRNAWNEDGTPYPAYHGYPIAARELAAEMNVPLVDLDKRSGELMIDLGKSYVGPYWYMKMVAGEYSNYPSGNSDDVHFQRAGAIEMARLVMDELMQTTDYPSIDSITQYVKAYHQVEVLTNDADAGLITRTASYPEGVEVHLKVRPNQGYVFKGWENETGTIVSTNVVYTFKMGNEDASYTAKFEYVGFGASEVWIEAECGEMGDLWKVVDYPLASSGKYVTIQPGNTSGSSAPGESGQISYTFNVAGGVYYLYWRVYLPSVTQDSFWMKLDGGSWTKVTWDVAITSFTWKQVMSVELAEGEHEMKIGYRESGAILDKMYWGSTEPTGVGVEDTCCCDTETAIDAIQANDIFTQHIWSNEAQSHFVQYELKKPCQLSFSLYNALGQKVYNESLGKVNEGIYQHSFQANLKPGHYFLQTFTDDQSKVTKFLIQ